MDCLCLGVWGSPNQGELCGLNGKLLGPVQDFSNTFFPLRATSPINAYRAHSQLFTHMEQRIQKSSKHKTHSHMALECMTYAAA